MADSDCIVQYHDPYDDTIAYCESFFNFNENNVSLDNIDGLNYPVDSFIPQTCDDAYIEDVIEPFDDPVLWDYCFNPNPTDTEMTPPENWLVDEDIRLVANVENRPTHSWQDRISPIDLHQPCSCCQVLREILHTNGTHTTKLELHGTLGIICHAVLENQPIHQGALQPGSASQMFDFCKSSIEDVKQFLEQYCEDRRQGGYIMLQDPLSLYYEALCVGLDWDDDNLIIDEYYFEQSPPNTVPPSFVECQMNHQEQEKRGERLYKTSLAVQRERTGKLTLRDMSNCFHLPIEEAAKRLNVCPTVVKKICRRNGLTRWPHRKIKSLERHISIMSQALNSTLDDREKARIEADISRIQVEMANLCGGIFPRR